MKVFNGVLIVMILSVGPVAPARAQMAVVDVRAIVQLVQQIRTMQQQLSTAQEELRAVTGARGMERLLAGEARNYLPRDAAELRAAVAGGGGGFPALAARLAQLQAEAGVLGAQDLAGRSAETRSFVESGRAAAALRVGVSEAALATTSARFQSLEGLIGAIGGAADQKAALDLAARIGAENAMLANERTKLEVLAMLAEGEALADAQRRRERAVADVGSLRRLPPLGL